MMFNANTNILSPSGTWGISRFNKGDLVTSRGSASLVVGGVQSASKHLSLMGRVGFSNGRELVGSPDSVVFTNVGFKPLIHLIVGMKVFDIDSPFVALVDVTEIWAQESNQLGYSMTITGESNYFANTILVHNDSHSSKDTK